MATFYLIPKDEDLQHHGVKGQTWGIRNGPPYPIEKGHRGRNYYADYTTKGRLFCDSVLREGTTFKRVQVGKDFEQYEFYATHKHKDTKYYGEEFSKNLIKRGQNPDDIYQIKLKATKDLKIPSITKASNIVANKMLRDSRTRDDMKFVSKVKLGKLNHMNLSDLTGNENDIIDWTEYGKKAIEICERKNIKYIVKYALKLFL